MKVASEAPARATSPPDGAAPEDESSPSRWLVAAAVLVIAAGIVMRFATRSDLWLDEALSVNISRLPYGDIPEWLRHDGAPPLYYFMLHAWTDVFGTSDFAVRSLSGVVSVATFVPMWFAGRRVGGRAGAWIAVLILASSPFAIGFGSDAHVLARDAARDGRLPGRPATPRTSVARPPGRRRAHHRPAPVHALLVLLPDRGGGRAVDLAGVAECGRGTATCGAVGPRRARGRGHHVPALDPDLPVPVGAHRNAVGRRHLRDGVVRVRAPRLRRGRALGGVRPPGRPHHAGDRRRVRACDRPVPHRARRAHSARCPGRDGDLGGHAPAGRRVRVRHARHVRRPIRLDSLSAVRPGDRVRAHRVCGQAHPRRPARRRGDHRPRKRASQRARQPHPGGAGPPMPSEPTPSPETSSCIAPTRSGPA